MLKMGIADPRTIARHQQKLLSLCAVAKLWVVKAQTFKALAKRLEGV